MLPTVTIGGLWPQPEVSPVWQVRVLIIDTERPCRLVTYTVLLAASNAALNGDGPTVTVAGFCPHPEVLAALQVAPSMTETVSPLPFTPGPLSVTYRVSVTGSTAIPTGPFPASTVAGFCPQPEVLTALQVAALITETVLLNALV